MTSTTLKCSRCKGSGRFFSTRGRDVGPCFACKGSGEVVTKKSELPDYRFPRVIQLCLENNISLHLPTCKIVKSQSGTIWLAALTYGAGLFGEFLPNGDFFERRGFTDEMLNQLQEVEERGLEAIQEFGKLTGVCCICGRMLTNEESINLGIGPICAGNVLGWGKQYRNDPDVKLEEI